MQQRLTPPLYISRKEAVVSGEVSPEPPPDLPISAASATLFRTMHQTPHSSIPPAPIPTCARPSAGCYSIHCHSVGLALSQLFTWQRVYLSQPWAAASPGECCSLGRLRQQPFSHLPGGSLHHRRLVGQDLPFMNPCCVAPVPRCPMRAV